MTNEQRKQLCEACCIIPMFAERRRGDKYYLQGEVYGGFQWFVTIDANTGAYLIDFKDDQGREYPPPEHRREADNQILDAARKLAVASRFEGMSSYISSNLGQLVTEAIEHTKANPLTDEECWWSRQVNDNMLKQAERDRLEDIEEDIKKLNRKAFDRGGKFSCQQRLAMMLATGIEPDSDLWEIKDNDKVVGTVSAYTGNPMAVNVDSLPLEDLPRSSADPDHGLFGPIKALDERIEQLPGAGDYKKYVVKAKRKMIKYYEEEPKKSALGSMFDGSLFEQLTGVRR